MKQIFTYRGNIPDHANKNYTNVLALFENILELLKQVWEAVGVREIQVS